MSPEHFVDGAKMMGPGNKDLYYLVNYGASSSNSYIDPSYVDENSNAKDSENTTPSVQSISSHNSNIDDNQNSNAKDSENTTPSIQSIGTHNSDINDNQNSNAKDSENTTPSIQSIGTHNTTGNKRKKLNHSNNDSINYYEAISDDEISDPIHTPNNVNSDLNQSAVDQALRPKITSLENPRVTHLKDQQNNQNDSVKKSTNATTNPLQFLAYPLKKIFIPKLLKIDSQASTSVDVIKKNTVLKPLKPKVGNPESHSKQINNNRKLNNKSVYILFLIKKDASIRYSRERNPLNVPKSYGKYIEKFCYKFGFELDDSMSDKVTHLIVKSDKAFTSPVYLPDYITAIVSNCIVVTIKWMSESLKHKRLLSEVSFIPDESYYNRYGLMLSASVKLGIIYPTMEWINWCVLYFHFSVRNHHWWARIQLWLIKLNIKVVDSVEDFANYESLEPLVIVYLNEKVQREIKQRFFDEKDDKISPCDKLENVPSKTTVIEWLTGPHNILTVHMEWLMKCFTSSRLVALTEYDLLLTNYTEYEY